MGLDYTAGCVNFRDVGAFINLIADQRIVPERRLYRGGSIDYVTSPEDIDHPKSIFNLRNGPDPVSWDIDYYHFPMSNKIEKYDTSQKEVQAWLNEIVSTFEEEALQYPVLIHCLSGKDRTGIVTGALLKILGISDEWIIEEYLLSDGEVKREWIEQALDGIGMPENYFKRVDLAKVKHNFLKLD